MITWVSSSTSTTSRQPPATPGRPRDATATRALLLAAALRRFTEDGYDTTTTRQIAEDAGGNVALISRYFGSKEGLFEACLEQAAAALQTAAGDVTEAPSGAASRGADDDVWTRIATAMTRQAIGAQPGFGPHDLLLLLRSSGDPAAERLRLAVLGGFAERLATAAGRSSDVDDEFHLLRAQVLLATAVGITVLRTSNGLEPLASATQPQLLAPVYDVVRALLA